VEFGRLPRPKAETVLVGERILPGSVSA